VPSALRTELREVFSVVWEKRLPVRRMNRTEVMVVNLVMASPVICGQEVSQKHIIYGLGRRFAVKTGPLRQEKVRGFVTNAREIVCLL